MYVALIVDPEKFSFLTLRRAIEHAGSGGKLDLVILHLPTCFAAKEQVIRKLYGYSGKLNKDHTTPEEVDITVVFGFANKQWDHVYVPQAIPFLFDGSKEVILPTDGEDLTAIEHPSAITEFPVGAVGGTFDHLHRGHKLLLTLSAIVVHSKLIVGITGPELLKNKKHAEALESYEVREKAVRSFLDYIKPGLVVETAEIHDVYGPTASEEFIDCLIVSHETRAGAVQINDLRKSKGWNELTVVEVGLVSSDHGGDKLSSTDLRKQELDAKRNKI